METEKNDKEKIPCPNSGRYVAANKCPLCNTRMDRRDNSDYHPNWTGVVNKIS